jgi:hypothetical protein
LIIITYLQMSEKPGQRDKHSEKTLPQNIEQPETTDKQYFTKPVKLTKASNNSGF